MSEGTETGTAAVAAPTETGPLRRIPFTPADEAKIRSLASWMAIVGWVYLVLVVADILSILFTRQLGSLPNALLRAFIGWWCLQGSDAFHKVATSDVADQDYLVVGFQKLRAIFLLESILIIVALALVCGLVVLGFLMAVSHRGA